MDPNLLNIREANMYAITHGKVQRAINQAEDYLVHTLGFNQKQIQTELDSFVGNIKQVRRESRGQKRKERRRKD